MDYNPLDDEEEYHEDPDENYEERDYQEREEQDLHQQQDFPPITRLLLLDFFTGLFGFWKKDNRE